jgi:hypothetical protein
LRLRIQLAEVHPAIWRRLLVPGDVSLAKLHSILQAAMGWTDSHLHNFRVGDKLFGPQYDDHPEEELDETSVTAIQAIDRHRRFGYDYDFGDGWEHEIVVEELAETPSALRFAVCIDGQNACPPEDCGGPPGYAHLLEVLSTPSHDEHHDFVDWLGGPFDPEAFDLAESNVALQRVR